MMARVKNPLAKLATLPRAELRAQWSEAFGSAAPSLPEALLRMALAYRIQEKRGGGLPVAVAKALKRAGAGGGVATAPPVPVLNPGARLVRSWNGRTIEVLVTEDGFLFADQRYRSLSAIARAVTGAAWSGPRFFGLNAHA